MLPLNLQNPKDPPNHHFHRIGLIFMWIWCSIIIFVSKRKFFLSWFLSQFFFFCNGNFHDFSDHNFFKLYSSFSFPLTAYFLPFLIFIFTCDDGGWELMFLKPHLPNKITFTIKEALLILKRNWWYFFWKVVNVILALIMD